MQKIETEVKFFLADIPPMRARILALGACSRGRYFETNLRYEDPAQSLVRKKSLLRLRRSATATLTFKSPPGREDHEFKTLTELEVEVSDFTTMDRILTSLGFHAEQRYEKWRETLVLDQTEFCLDSMPYGDFLEIEGARQAIRDYAGRLGLDWQKRILANYLQLFEFIRQKMALPFSDVTFENFNNINVPPDIFLDSFAGGNA